MVCKTRTWQSLKERYIKRIKLNLISKSYKFPFLSMSDLKLLRQGLNIDFIKNQDREIQKSKFREERIDNWSSEYSN